MRRIIKRCKCGVFLTINEHKDYYEKAEEYLEDRHDELSDTLDEIKKEMIKRDTVMSLQFYPDTPVGHYVIYHYDYDELIKIALKILEEQNELKTG